MPNSTDVPMLTLNNGLTMPQLGLGVWQAEDGDEAKQAVLTALQSGYRLIDTAAIYGNEASVGAAIRESGLAREQLFVTTKLWNGDQGYDSALAAYDASLERLGLDYVDLYLIHWPVPAQGKYVESWRALEKLYASKRVKAIGVSNFQPHHIDDILQDGGTVPVINQIELHPHHQQADVRDYCRQHGIQVESYSPLKQGGDVLEDPVVAELAGKHGKTPAQVVLRWHIQEGLIVIPKSVTPDRIRSNIDVFGFQLDDNDMERLRGLNRDDRVAPHPDTANFT